MVSASALMLLYSSRGEGASVGNVSLGAEITEDFASDVALGAADEFGFGLTLGGAPPDILQCRLVAEQAGEARPVQSGVGLAVASSVEPMQRRLPA